LQSYKIFQGIAVPYSALISVVFGLLAFSFPIGAYLFFNSGIGKSIDYQYPLGELEFVRNLGIDWIGTIGIGDVFVVTWMFFLILFAIAAFGPRRNFMRVLTPIMAGTVDRQEGNYLVQTIKWFSVIIVLSAVIDIIQRSFGITTTPPAFGNDLVQMMLVSVAPIIEEVGFRIILVGIPVYLLYARRASVKNFFKALWNPSDALDIFDARKAIAIIVISAVLFGVAHVMTDQGWTSGKLAQAAMSGIIIGWVYVRYGFVAAILIHWATNYVVFSYGYLVASINDVGIMEAFSHSLIQTIEIIFVVTGILSLAMIWFCNKKHQMSSASLSPL
jgi:hypothetical protein